MAEQDKNKVVLRLDRFSLAVHNGIITVTNPQTQKAKTFRIQTLLGGAMAGARAVQVQIGPDQADWHSWATFGLIEHGRVQLWLRWNTPTYQGYTRLLQEPMTYARRGYVYTIEIHCRRCNEVLIDPESVARGLGPMCQAYTFD